MEFNINRFTLILKKDFLQYRKWIGLGLITLALAVLCITIIGHNLIPMENGGASQLLMVGYFMILTIGGGYLASTNFGDLRSAGRRIQYLTLPASTFEKVLSKWLYTLPFYLISITGIFWLVFATYGASFHDQFSENTLLVNQRIQSRMGLYYIILYVVGHSIAFFFSYVFNRYTAILGALISFSIFMLMGFINMLIFHFPSSISFNSLIEACNTSMWHVMTKIGDHPFQLLIIAPIFWILTYFVAKRKQV